MSAATAWRSVPTPRPVGVAVLLAATLLSAAAGAAIGGMLASDGSDPRIADARPHLGLASGVARLPLPADWLPLGLHSSLPGLEEATAVRGGQFDVALDIRAPEDASLLPARVEAATPGGLPVPRPRRLGGRTAWRYDLPATGAGPRVAALALPTTGGVVTIACASSDGAIARAGRECERAARSLQLVGASALQPAHETAAAILLPRVAARLDRRRTLERRRLAATRSPRRRSEAALRLARAYADAAAQLRPVAAGAAEGLTGALDGLARAHRALAGASLRRDAAAALQAGAAIEQGERRVTALLATVTERVSPARAAPDTAS
jgi:hypothetical protein